MTEPVKVEVRIFSSAEKCTENGLGNVRGDELLADPGSYGLVRLKVVSSAREFQGFISGYSLLRCAFAKITVDPETSEEEESAFTADLETALDWLNPDA